jgi:hypothetical protein
LDRINIREMFTDIDFLLQTGVELSTLLLRLLIGLLYHPCTTDGDDSGAVSGMTDWQRKPEYSKKTCPSAASSITNPRQLESGLPWWETRG